jgi:ubiquinone/menaquinone biosynthesis C-methylase UbiE
MIAYLFMELTDYPFFRRLVWRPIYEQLAKRFAIKDWYFMNYGYARAEHEAKVELETADEPNRYPLQLYYYLASKVDIKDMHLLEVGSGRGGGSSAIKKYLSPSSITGLDIASNAVKFANTNLRSEGLSYIQGNAENLPFDNDKFDVVINVESCHAYGSVPKFLQEVKRVLKPGGYFLCTDIRSPEGMKKLRQQLGESGMDMLEENDIGSNVVNAIELEESLKQKRIEEHIPKWFQKTFREFAGVVGSKIHSDLKSGSLVYSRFVLRKK